MENYDYVGAIMDFEEGSLTDEQVIKLFQYLVDTGIAWKLQGSYGFLAYNMIQDGHIKRRI
jgi:hypothetical protein